MWRLLNIHAQNLCAFQELKYELNQGHTTLVFGNNLDNDSQVSNGSGKSAMIEAIAIGLTGSTLRDIKMEEVINDQADNALVALVLMNDATGVVMDIRRELSRKNPQAIHVTLTEKGKSEEIAQPSVNDYNKYILDMIGLTKDDIFSNYILSKHKYQSFLSSSDREKKEIINRFSNGIIVDESIAALQADMEPIKDDLQAAERNVATCTGRVSAIDEQIATAINESGQRAENKKKRIADWNEAIANKRALIREKNELVKSANERLDVLDNVDAKLRTLEDGDAGFDADYTSICKLFKTNELPAIKDYQQSISDLQSRLNYKKNEAELAAQAVDNAEEELDKFKTSFSALQKEHEEFENGFQSRYEEVSAQIQQLLDQVKQLEDKNKQLRSRGLAIKNNIGTIQTQLAGVVTCPKCKHEFTLNADEDVASLKQSLTSLQSEQTQIETDIAKNDSAISQTTERGKQVREKQNSLNTERATWSERITNAQQRVNELTRKVSRQNSLLEEVNSEIGSIKKSIVSMRTSMFDEAFDILDTVTKREETTLNSCKTDIETANGAISSYEESIKELENATDEDIVVNLKKSKQKYEKDLEGANAELETIQSKLMEYQKQEATFVEFKTHLANTKIEALSHITNEFLEAIGSDIRIAFSGYTVLKSGKVRDKISISLIRDGIDGGSFNKYSEGEKSRVNLANILAMHKLTNVNCVDDKGLDLLILDEILDACDEEGLSNMFNALNQLKITSLVVSHGNIAENYPYKLVVNKQNGISFI